jgi:tRNA-specific 2-thiouridylase
MQTHTLWVVQGHEHPWLLSQSLSAADASWVAGSAPPCGQAFAAKTRYRQSDSACALQSSDGPLFNVGFESPQWAVTPGQSAVLYDGDVCLGGGVIDSVSPLDAAM